jgi:ribosomal protein L28
MGRKCQLTGKKANNAYAISHSHRRTKRLQEANLQKQARLVAPGQALGQTAAVHQGDQNPADHKGSKPWLRKLASTSTSSRVQWYQASIELKTGFLPGK